MTTKDTQTPIGADLTPQQFRYVEEYLIDPSNQKEAAIRAGYAAKNAASIASHLMNNLKIRAAIELGQKARAERLGITQDRVLQELALLAFSNIADIVSQDAEGNTVVDLKSLPRNIAAALGDFSVSVSGGKNKIKTTKIRLADKIAALTKLGQHLNMFKEKVEHSGVLTLEQLVAQSMQDEIKED